MREGSWLRKGAIVASWLAPATSEIQPPLKGEPSVDIGKIVSIFGEREKYFLLAIKLWIIKANCGLLITFESTDTQSHKERKHCKYLIQQIMTSIALVSDQSYYKIMQ